ncbi:MAG: O-antigen ligase family protein [Candidatus Paceibacterota bacterium]
MRRTANVLPLLVAAVIFLAPLNLFLKWGELNAYVGGIFTDYLVQKLWLSEIPLLLALFLWLPKKIIQEKRKIIPFFKKNKIWLSLFILLVIRQFFSPLPMVSFWYLAKAIELSLFIWLLRTNRSIFNHPLLRRAILLALLLQIGVASLQFARQKSLFDYFVLGETQLTGSINIARVNFKSGEMILPYGTTAHPNILAGIVAIFSLSWLHLQAKFKKQFGWWELMVVGLSSWVLFLTQSFTAILAFSLFLFLQSFPKLKKIGYYLASNLLVLIPLLIFLIPAQLQTESLFRRNFLNSQTITVIAHQPFIGIGANMFTTTLKAPFSNAGELIRFIQPTHNVPLLFFAETGLLGLVLIYLLIKKYLLKIDPAWLVLLAVLLSLDHYLVTQWVGGILLVLILSSNEAQK